MEHPHLEFTLEVMATSGRYYHSGLVITPYTADMTPDQAHDVVVQRLTDDWSLSEPFVMALPNGEAICINPAHIEAITVHWEPQTEPPPAGEVAGGGVATDYAESAE